MAYRVLTAALVLVLLLTVACSSDDKDSQAKHSPAPTTRPGGTQSSPSRQLQLKELASNRGKWRDAAIVDYQFDVTISCFCALERKPVMITVHGDNALMTHADGTPFDRIANGYDLFFRYSTINRVFDAISESLTEANSVSIAYDSEYSYPKLIGLDATADTTDDEMSITISSFEVLE